MNNQRFQVLVTAQHLLPEAQELLINAGGQIEFMQEPINEVTLADRLSKGDVDAVLLRGSKPFSEAVLSSSKGLKIIAKNGAGIDSVDLNIAMERGIAVAVAAGANADAVAEHAIALMLALIRDLHTLTAKVKKGGWEGTSWQGRDFKGSTVGILGFGSIGRSTAKLAAALGANVLVYSANRKVADQFKVLNDLEEFLSQIDILSLHCPLNEKSKGLIGVKELSILKKGALVINTARGAVIDEQALVQSLESNHLGGAGLDTFEYEPLSADSPLLKMDNVILTPHVAGVTRNAALKVALTTAQNIINQLSGKALPKENLVVDSSSKR
jgi:D-3-phosphoglycerate dehydrogenase